MIRRTPDRHARLSTGPWRQRPPGNRQLKLVDEASPAVELDDPLSLAAAAVVVLAGAVVVGSVVGGAVVVVVLEVVGGTVVAGAVVIGAVGGGGSVVVGGRTPGLGEPATTRTAPA